MCCVLCECVCMCVFALHPFSILNYLWWNNPDPKCHVSTYAIEKEMENEREKNCVEHTLIGTSTWCDKHLNRILFSENKQHVIRRRATALWLSSSQHWSAAFSITVGCHYSWNGSAAAKKHRKHTHKNSDWVGVSAHSWKNCWKVKEPRTNAMWHFANTQPSIQNYGTNNVKKSKNIVYWIFYCDSLKMFDSHNMNPNLSEYNLKKRRKMAKTEF